MNDAAVGESLRDVIVEYDSLQSRLIHALVAALPLDSRSDPRLWPASASIELDADRWSFVAHERGFRFESERDRRVIDAHQLILGASSVIDAFRIEVYLRSCAVIAVDSDGQAVRVEHDALEAVCGRLVDAGFLVELSAPGTVPHRIYLLARQRRLVESAIGTVPITPALDELLHEFRRNPPASAEVVAASEQALALQFPADYQGFLRHANGGCGFIGDSYFALWRVEELKEWNLNYAIAERAPWLLAFGSNGGGEAYAFDTRVEPPVIVVVPFLDLGFETALLVAPTFTEFLARVSTVGPFGEA